MKNPQKNESYNQVCVWPGTLLPPDQVENFVNYFAENGFRIQHLETIMTQPDRGQDGLEEPETGGRSDIFFAVHDDDIMRFAIPRLQMGIRWIEDVLDNEARETEHSIYPVRVQEYRTW